LHRQFFDALLLASDDLLKSLGDAFDMLDSVLKAAGANGISQVLSILVAVKAGKPVPEVAEMPEFSSRSTTFYMTKP